MFAVAICDLKEALGDAHFRIRSINLPQGFADFADGGVSADGIHNVRHGIGIGNIAIRASCGSLGGGLFERLQAALHFFV